jgi:hypothetical protein
MNARNTSLSLTALVLGLLLTTSAASAAYGGRTPGAQHTSASPASDTNYDAAIHSGSESVCAQSFRAYAPPVSKWGFASYGEWVTLGSGDGAQHRIIARSTNGVDIDMQASYIGTDGRARVDAAGGFSSKIDFTFTTHKSGSIMVRFKVGTLNNPNKQGAEITGTIY